MFGGENGDLTLAASCFFSKSFTAIGSWHLGDLLRRMVRQLVPKLGDEVGEKSWEVDLVLLRFFVLGLAKTVFGDFCFSRVL